MRVSGTKVTPPSADTKPKENNPKVINKTPSVSSMASTRGATNTTASKASSRYNNQPALSQKTSSASSAHTTNPLTDDLQSEVGDPV